MLMIARNGQYFSLENIKSLNALANKHHSSEVFIIKTIKQHG